MIFPPISVIETWPAANYTDPVTLGHGVTIVVLVLTIIALSTVSLRIYTRVCLVKAFGPDDYLLTLAMFIASIYAVVAVVAVEKYGIGRHVWDSPIPWDLVNLKLTIIAEGLFAGSACLTRVAMLFFVRRLLGPTSPRLKLFINMGIGLIACQCVGFILTLCLQCLPLSLYWTLSLTPQNCPINEAANLLACGTINTISDFFVVLIPIPIVAKLQMSVRSRITVSVLFSLGFILCGAGIARIVFTSRLTTSSDKTWEGYFVYLTGSIELLIGIIVTSIPSLKPFFTKYFPTSMFSLSGSSDSGSGSDQHNERFPWSSKTSYLRAKQTWLASSSSDGIIHIISAKSSNWTLKSFREKWKGQDAPQVSSSGLEMTHPTMSMSSNVGFDIQRIPSNHSAISDNWRLPSMKELSTNTYRRTDVTL